MTLLTRRGAAAEFVEEVQQKRQARGRLLGTRIVRDHRRDKLAVRRKIVVGIDAKIPTPQTLTVGSIIGRATAGLEAGS